MAQPELIASLPPLKFTSAADAPVSHQWCLVGPEADEWCIARRDAEGWVNAEEAYIDDPLVYAPLPPAPGMHHPKLIANLAHFVADRIDAGDYADAAELIDELADRVRAVRDSKPR